MVGLNDTTILLIKINNRQDKRKGITMKTIKKFFKIEGAYKFEMNDIRAALQLVNVALIVFVGFDVGAIFGLSIATLGLIKDLCTDRHINGMAMHAASIALNIFILCI